MVLTATLYVEQDGDIVAPDADGRQAERRTVQAGATLRGAEKTPIDAEVVDLSTSGCLLALSGDLKIPSMVTIGIAGIGRIDACVVRRDGNRFGCAFLQPLSDAAVAMARSVEPAVPLGAPALPTPVVQPLADANRLPIGTRVWLIIGSGFLAWGVVIAVVLAIRALVG